MDNFKISICSRCLDKNKRKVKDSFKKFLKEYDVFLSNYELFVYELLSRNQNENDTVDNLVKLVADEYKSHKLDILKKSYIDEKRMVNDYYRNPNIKSEIYKKKQSNFNKYNKFNVKEQISFESPNNNLKDFANKSSKIKELNDIVDTPLSEDEFNDLENILNDFDLKRLRFIYSRSLSTDDKDDIIDELLNCLCEFNIDLEYIKTASELELRAYITYIKDKFEGEKPDYIPFDEVIESFKKQDESLNDVINLDFDELYKRIELANKQFKKCKNTTYSKFNPKVSNLKKSKNDSKHLSPEYFGLVDDIKVFNSNFNDIFSESISSEGEIDKLINESEEIENKLNKDSVLNRQVKNKNWHLYNDFHNNKSNLINTCEILKFNIIFNKYESEIKLLNKLSPNKYYSYRARQELISRFKEPYDELIKLNFSKLNFSKYNVIKFSLSKLNLKISDEMKNNLIYFVKVYDDLVNYRNLQQDNFISKLNEEYISNEINSNYDLLKDLNDSQRRAVVIDEENVQIIAGAGTGKTTTLVTKIKYLIESKCVDPSKIIALSFSNASAKDLRAKLNASLKINNEVEVSTFHKLGRNILNNNEGTSIIDSKYSILDEVIDNYLSENLDKESINSIMEFFAFYFYNYQIVVDEFSTKKELDEYIRGSKLKTLKRKYGEDLDKITLKEERVKSLEELIIANFLFMNNIEYIYEMNFVQDYTYELDRIIFKDLEEDIPLNMRMPFLMYLSEYLDIKNPKKCFPDFYLPEYNIYLEHWGVDENGNANWLSKQGSQDYKNGMMKKINYFNKHHVRFISTYSHYQTKGILLQKLKELLEKEGVKLKEKPYSEVYQKLLEKDKKRKEFKDFKKLIKLFINLFESKKLALDEFDSFKYTNSLEKDYYDKKRNGLFLGLVEDIYKKYLDYKFNVKNKIDFNDMINKGIDSLKEHGYKDFDYILVDEYQDVSYNNYLLLKTLKEKSNAKLIVVGDDWQSIYKFRGSDVNLFKDLKFKPLEKIKLSTNYRCPKDVVNVSNKFIRLNNIQIPKELKSNKSIPNPLHIVSTKWLSEYNRENSYQKSDCLEYIIHYFKEQYGDNLKNRKILLLGRYNNDIDFLKYNKYSNFTVYTDEDKKFSKIIYNPMKELNIEFRTVHRAKGLEADEVIILGLYDKINGFPNKMGTDSVLRFVSVDGNDYEEERRLFYVALTRTKNNVFLFVPSNKKSEFIEPIKHHLKVFNKTYKLEKIKFEKGKPLDTILECKKCGKIIQVCDIGYTKQLRCSNSDCDWDGAEYSHITPGDIGYFRHCPRDGCDGIQIVKGKKRNMLGCTNYNDSGDGCNVMLTLDGGLWKDQDGTTYDNLKQVNFDGEIEE